MKHLFTVLIVFILAISISNAQYKYENPVWVKNNTASALTNVQVGIKVNTQTLISAGWMQPTGNDIRFVTTCNSTTFLTHWLEGYINTDSTKIWVKIPAIGANDSTLIFLYFGNSTATSISTLSTFDGPNSSTDSVMVSSSNTVANAQRGFRFTANEDVLVGYFGKRVYTATQRYVTLFDVSTQSLLAQTQVDAGVVGVFNYNALANPLWLKAGTQYVLSVFGATGDYYYYGASTQIGQAFTYGEARYCNSCTQNTFPTSIVSGYHYGTPDLLYYTKQNVTPAPTYRVLNPADTVTPAVPINLTATPGNGNALLKWRKNTEFDIYQYGCYKSTINNPATATYIATIYHPDTSFTATGLTNGIMYYFWVKAIDGYCVSRISDFSLVASCLAVNISAIGNEIPDKYYLAQNYPNPFNPNTTIKFGLKKQSNFSLNVYDALGRQVRTIIRSNQPAGNYEFILNGQELASGIYFYKLETGDFTSLKKMVLIK